MSQTGRLENETWVHLGCWLRERLGELHDVGKLCPEKGKNLVFQGGTEFPVRQTHSLKAIWEIAQHLCQTYSWNCSSSSCWVFWLCPFLWCWPCGHVLLSTLLSTAQFAGEDLWAWTREAPLQSLKHSHIFPVNSFHPFYSEPHRFSSTGLGTQMFFSSSSTTLS